MVDALWLSCENRIVHACIMRLVWQVLSSQLCLAMVVSRSFGVAILLQACTHPRMSEFPCRRGAPCHTHIRETRKPRYDLPRCQLASHGHFQNAQNNKTSLLLRLENEWTHARKYGTPNIRLMCLAFCDSAGRSRQSCMQIELSRVFRAERDHWYIGRNASL